MSSCPPEALPILRWPSRITTIHHVDAWTVRLVWAAVTLTPGASIVELSASAGIARSQVFWSLKWLEAAGYIEAAPIKARARRVLVPFAVLPRGAIRTEDRPC